MEAALWYTTLAASLILSVSGLLCFILRKAGTKGGGIRGIVLVFLAGWLMGIPYEYFTDIPASAPGLHMLESVLTALLNTFDTYLGNGAARYVFEGHEVFTAVYNIVAVVIDIVFICFVMGFILSLLNGPMQKLRFSFRNGRKACIFSAANEKSLAIAGSLPAGKRSMVFCLPELPEDETRQKILQLGGVYLTCSVGDALRSRKNCGRDTEVFLFGQSEAENLRALNTICSVDTAAFRSPVRVCAEITDIPWNFFSAPPENDRLTVNLVRTAENFACNLLLKHSIFDDAVETAQGKEIRLLLVGMDPKSTELLKAALFLGQMPGYRLTIMVLDSGTGRSALRQRMPEVYDECHTDGDAEYTLLYRENVDFSGCDPETIVGNSFADFTWAYVDTGDDLADFLMARRLYTLKQRMAMPDAYRIYAAVRSPEFLSSGRLSIPEKIVPVGSAADDYRYDFITMSDIEKASGAIHEVRQREKPENKRRTWQAYCANEYNRHSVYARTLSYKFKAQLIERFYDGQYSLASSDPVWKKYEHMRWDMYTRVSGYIRPGAALTEKHGADMKPLRASALVHPDLVPFTELSIEEQEKDAMKITDEIAAILRNI